jgi:hypothetical protein
MSDKESEILELYKKMINSDLDRNGNFVFVSSRNWYLINDKIGSVENLYSSM